MEMNTNNEPTVAAESLQTGPSLPDKPLITIKSSKKVALGFRDLWAYPDLFYFLVGRDVKMRYKQTVLGVVWAIIQPLFLTVIFTIVFSVLAGIGSDSVPYPLFAYSGLLLYVFFANAVTNSSNSLIGDPNLITKIYFPRLLLPTAAVGGGLVDLAIASVVLVMMMIYYRVGVTANIVILPVLVVLITLLALGVGMLLAALNVKYRDVRYLVPFLLQLTMYVSPVIYPTTILKTILPERLHWVYGLNPLGGIIEGFRAALFGLGLDWLALSISGVVTLGLLLCSAYIFRRMEKSFADVI